MTRTKSTSKIPGKKVIHQEPLKMYSNPDRIKEPRDGLVTGMPSPIRAGNRVTADLGRLGTVSATLVDP